MAVRRGSSEHRDRRNKKVSIHMHEAGAMLLSARRWQKSFIPYFYFVDEQLFEMKQWLRVHAKFLCE